MERATSGGNLKKMASNTEGFMQTLAETLSTRETILRYLISLGVGYPLAFLYRYSIFGKTAAVQHIYFTLCGICIAAFNFGFAAFHVVMNTVLMYLILRISPGTKLSVTLAYIVNNTYLMIGYYSLDEYVDISWAIPQCVLTLKLTGLAMDIYDGHKKMEKLTEEQKQTALQEVPSLLAMLGHAFFFGGFLAGPQFSMKRYLAFTNGTLMDDEKSKDPPPSVAPGLRRLMIGVVYIAIHHIGGLFVPNSYFFQKEFEELNYFFKCLYVIAFGRFVISKYVGVWLVTEGACIVTGFSYNGQDVNGNILWNAASNVRVRKLEKSCLLRDVIQSFNIETNKWMSRYIFKRLRFLGNKLVSQAVTLLYLAFWHGIRSGYYMNFALEFFMINCETQALSIASKIPLLQKINSIKALQPLLWILKKFYSTWCMGYALLSFVLLDANKFLYVYKVLYFMGHVIFILLPVAFAALQTVLPLHKHTQNGEIHGKKLSAAAASNVKKE